MTSLDTLLLSATTFELGPQRMSGWILFGIVVGVIVLPFIIGKFVATALKSKEDANRISTVLLTIFLATTPFVFQIVRASINQSRYDSAVEAAETKNQSYKIDDEGVAKINEAMPNVTVQR